MHSSSPLLQLFYEIHTYYFNIYNIHPDYFTTIMIFMRIILTCEIIHIHPYEC